MKKILFILTFCLVMVMGVLYASEETIFIKDAPDYKLYYNDNHVVVISNLQKDEKLSNDLIKNNNLIERYQVYLPIYVQIADDGIIARANLIKNWESSFTEKELNIRRENNKLEVMFEQLIGVPDGVGMTSETINQGRRIYDYQINWTTRENTQKRSELKVCVIREYEQEKYDYIYKNMINKNYTNIYQTVMEMSNIELTVLENYLSAMYGVDWDVDAKLIQEMRELNIAKISFADLLENHWAYNVIKSMAIKGVLNGYEDNTFRPENNITRAESAQIISKLFNLSDENKNEIKDLSENHWAYVAIKRASLYIPMEENNFNPDENITRKDFIIAIMDIRGTDRKETENAFSDLESLTEDEISKINLAYSLNIANGYEDGSFKPNAPLTRAEACAILTRSR